MVCSTKVLQLNLPWSTVRLLGLLGLISLHLRVHSLSLFELRLKKSEFIFFLEDTFMPVKLLHIILF